MLCRSRTEAVSAYGTVAFWVKAFNRSGQECPRASSFPPMAALRSCQSVRFISPFHGRLWHEPRFLSQQHFHHGGTRWIISTPNVLDKRSSSPFSAVPLPVLLPGFSSRQRPENR